MQTIFLISGFPFLLGILLFWCFRHSQKPFLVPMLCALPTAALAAYASSNPIPGNEGPGLLAMMFVCLTLGTLAAWMLLRFLPKGDGLLRSPALYLVLYLLGLFCSCGLLGMTVTVLLGGAEGTALVLTGLLFLFYGAAGYLLPAYAQPRDRRILAAVLAVCSLGFAALLYISVTADLFALYFLIVPYIAAAQTMFPGFFSTPQSAFVLNVLQPLLISAAPLLMMGGFALGLFLRRHNSRKE